ncbi:hypothetical protein EMGBD2_01360 [Nitrospirota bacterium]|nr:hypothetical protein EMGBD2_01360 [Nitrospirota bacterium]
MNTVSTDLTDPTPFLCRPPVRRIIYGGLGLFLLLIVIWPLVAQLKDPDFQKHIAEHRVMVGMSKEQVLQAWGGPQTINTTFTTEGLRHEEWILKIGKTPQSSSTGTCTLKKAASSADGSRDPANGCPCKLRLIRTIRRHEASDESDNELWRFCNLHAAQFPWAARDG